MSYVRWCFSCAGVWCDVVKATEDLDGRIALDAIIFAQLCLLCAVNFDEGNILLFQSGCSLLILRCESLAVATPWRKELGKDKIVLFYEVFECVLPRKSDRCHML